MATVLGGGQGLMDKGGQWGGLVPKQVVQCPRQQGVGRIGEAVLDAEGLLGPFSVSQMQEVSRP